jgi:hypothetical protein
MRCSTGTEQVRENCGRSGERTGTDGLWKGTAARRGNRLSENESLEASCALGLMMPARRDIVGGCRDLSVAANGGLVNAQELMKMKCRKSQA